MSIDDEQEEADRIEAEQEADDLSKVPHCDCGSVTCLTACKSYAQEDPEEFCEDGYDM